MTVNQFIVRKSPALSVRVLKNFERCVQQGTLGWGLRFTSFLLVNDRLFLFFVVCLSFLGRGHFTHSCVLSALAFE